MLFFLFDMDDVLYDYDWRARMAGLTELTGLDLHELRRRWWHDDGEWAAEAGRFPDAASYHAAFVAALGTSRERRGVGRQPAVGDDPVARPPSRPSRAPPSSAR